MNRIYKVIKSDTTGCCVAVSELARGAKKGNKLKLASLLVLGILANKTYAIDSVPQGYNPGSNSNKNGSLTVSGADKEIDLGIDLGLNSAQKGDEAKKHTITSGDSISSLYNTKYTAVTNATNNFNKVQNDFNNGLSSQDQLDEAKNLLQQAKDKAALIDDNKLKVSDPNNLIGSNTEGTVIEKKDIKYKDPVTDKVFEINVIDNLVKTDANSDISGNSITVDFYEKTGSDKQYDDMQMLKVEGSDTDVTIVNSAGQGNNDQLTAISKNGSGVISVADGANLTIDTNISYYTGGTKSTSYAFDDKNEYSTSTTKDLYKINYKGNVDTALGPKTIQSEKDFNDFNKELINYIQTNEQIRLNYPTVEAMQAFYNSQIAGLYTVSKLGSYQVDFTLSKEELEQLAKEQGLENAFNNKVTKDDAATDIGMASTDNNHFIGVNGSGSAITVTENSTINSYIRDSEGKTDLSSGYFIRADFENSGINGNNIFNIAGSINAGQAILAKNAEIYVSKTGYIGGSIVVMGTGNYGTSTGNIIENAGKITGKVTTENAKVTNLDGGSLGGVDGGQNVSVINQNNAEITGNVSLGNTGSVSNSGSILGSITGGINSTISNNSGGKIGGGITVHDGSTVHNNEGGDIDGTVIVVGKNSSFINDGIVGGAHAENGAIITNNNLIIGSGVADLTDESVLTNNGDIYIGYSLDKNGQAIIGNANTKNYNGINISGIGTQLVNNKNIFVSATQHNVNVVSVSGGGEYIDTVGSVITLNKEDQPITAVDKDMGNDNKAIYVTGSDAKATIKGTITLNDVGSTALWVQDGGRINLSGTINLNSKNVADASGDPAKDVQVSNFGAWIQGENSTLVMDGNSLINLNSDRAIGVHVRDGARAEINDSAGITFSDKKNQLGFLISGVSKAASIVYNSNKLLQLHGDGSVLFRIERGSIFNSDTINSTNPSLSMLDSNNTKDSTLVIITNGPTSNGVNNQTSADLSSFSLNVNGENAKGIRVEGGAKVNITDKTIIKLTGDNSILAVVDGNYYDLNGVNVSKYNGKSYLASSANLTTDINNNAEQVVTGQNSTGYYVTNSGILDHKGTIDFKVPSKNNIGVKIDNGGTLISELGSYIKVHGTAVQISGSNSLATINNVGNGTNPVIWAIGAEGSQNDAAYHIKDQASLKLSGLGITKAQGTAHGILVDGASQVTLDGSIIDLYDFDSDSESSTGNGIENRSELQNIQLINNATINVKDGSGIHSSVGLKQSSNTSGTINVYGKGTGIRFENIDKNTGDVLGSTNNSINNTGYENVVINVFENTGHGIYVDSTKDVNTSASVNIISETGQSALEIKGETETASQSGNLHSANKNSVIIDLDNGYLNKLTNNGELLFGNFVKNSSNEYVFTAQDKSSAKNSYAIRTQATENGLNFTNDIKGKINGTVELLGYGDKTDPNDKTKGNTVKLSGEGNVFITGEGNDLFIVDTVVGDDLGGDNQVKQFTQLDGGAGDDQITFNNNSNFTINKDDTIKNIEYFSLENNSKVTLNNLNTIDGLNTGVTTYDIIDEASILTYKWNSSNTEFDRLLKGNGTFKVDFADVTRDSNRDNKPTNEFAFDNSTNTGDFTGTLELANTKYNLADSSSHKNTSALTQSTLKVSDNSYVNVGTGDQNINGLYFNGGTVDFGSINIGTDKSTNHIVVDKLVLDKGKIQIDTSGYIYNPSIPSSLPLLEQDDGVIFTKLVTANNVSGGAINVDIDRSLIKLFDENGKEITDPTQTDLIQNDEVIARATYDTRLSKGENSDGLYVGYGLTQIELKAKNDVKGNALILDATNSDTTKAGSSELDALIKDYDNGDGTFSYGDLQIRGSKAVTLSGSNSYHGTTFVKDTSTLISGSNNALGFTRLLQLDANTKFDLNGWNQTLGSLYTNDSSIVDINGGQLTIGGEDGTDSSKDLASYISAETLMGSGTLIIGDTTLTRNTSHLPQVSIAGNNSKLTANIINAVNGKIIMDSQGGLGSGNLTNNGELNLYFSDDSVLTNDTLVGNGVLNKYNAGSLTFTLPQAKDYSGTTNINAGSMIFKGDNSATTDGYKTSNVNIASGAALVGLDKVIFQGNINNSGKFYIGELPNSSTVSQNSVTVKNYTGNSGSNLIFNGKLTDDNSSIGKLIINGDSSGSSTVTVNNIGGLGAKTINGISIIDVNGESNATFTQSGRIIAGAYEYKLQRSKNNANNWVLLSDLTTRSEVGSYIGNLVSANNLFNLRLHDRLGETQYTDLLTGEQKVTSMWIRHQYGYNKFDVASGDLSVKNTWNITQLGGDIAQWSSDELNRLHLGIMAGYGRSTTKSVSNMDGSKSDGSIDGYTYGVYGTWYDNDKDKTGLYIDSWAIWNDFDASVSGKEFSEKYRLKGLTASLESGYAFKTGKLDNYDVWLQPKAQIIWSDVGTDDLIESNGTKVSSDTGNLQTRLGLRASLLSNQDMQVQTNQAAQLFIEANWIHNTKLYNVTLNDELTVGQDSGRNIGELKVGLEGNISQNTNIWFNLAGQRGDHNYQNASIMLGLKYSF